MARRDLAVGGDEGVLLVEFAALGRFTLSLDFPFIHASLKRLGVPVRWVRFALEPSARFGGDDGGIGLSAADARTLLELARDFPARRVLFSFQPSAALWRRLLAAHPGAEGRFYADGDAAGAGPDAKGLRPLARGDEALLSCLSLEGGARPPAFMAGDPDFGFLAGNVAARTMRPLAFVVAGEECVYRKSVIGNPVYEGVDLSGCRTEGCAFCVSGPGDGCGDGRRASDAEDALRQIAAFFRTYPLAGAAGRPRLRMAGQQLLREVEALAARLPALGLPPTDFLFDARMDYLLRLGGRLAGAAERLKGSGHKIHICLVGLENFSAAELRRMNKGITAAQSLAAIRLLRGLERTYPAEFGFEEHGGLSTIFFTPWTTLEDLALNFGVVDHFRLERLCGKILTSRVRLYEGLPLTALARRDGLLVERYDDAAFDTARLNFYADELAWTYRHPEVAEISRITTRMAANPAFACDPLYGRVQAWLKGRLAAGVSEVRCVLELVDRAMEIRGSRRAEELLKPAPQTRRRRAPGSSVPLPEKRDLMKMQRAGLARVSRLEPLERAAAERLGRRLSGSDGAALVVPRSLDGGAPPTWEVFFGPRPEDVAQAARLTDVQYSTTTDTAARAAAKRRIGELYGYPACCAEAFASFACSSPHLNEWMLVLRRSERPGPVDPLLTPYLAGINYIPCSALCRASARRSRAVLALSAGGTRRLSLAVKKNPVLFLLDRIGEYVELIPQGPVGRSFAFKAGAMRGDDRALRALRGGGTATIDAGVVTIDRDGRRVARFVLRAAVWWHRRAFDPDFWRECAREILERIPEEPRSPTPAAPARPRVEAAPRPEPAPPSAALAERLRPLLAGEKARFGDFTAASVEPRPGRSVAVTLARRTPRGDGGDLLIVHVEPLEGTGRYYKAVGGLAFGYSNETPLRTGAQIAALAALMAGLGGAGEAQRRPAQERSRRDHESPRRPPSPKRRR